MVTYKENKVQREHVFAIVDEVDSILIDEARTPLIISGQGDKSTELYTLADRFARTLKETRVAELNEKEDNDELYKDADYIVDEKSKTATLTPSGVKKAEAYFNIDNLTDADNITISGFSAGGRDVMAMLTSPLFAGRFQKAIAFSGGMTIADETASVSQIAWAIAPLAVEDGLFADTAAAKAWLMTDGEDVR